MDVLYVGVLRKDMLHKCNYHRKLKWSLLMSFQWQGIPIGMSTWAPLVSSDMSWTIEGPVTRFWVSGLQAQFTFLRDIMTMWYSCYVAATVVVMLNQQSVCLSGLHLRSWRAVSACSFLQTGQIISCFILIVRIALQPQLKFLISYWQYFRSSVYIAVIFYHQLFILKHQKILMQLYMLYSQWIILKPHLI